MKLLISVAAIATFIFAPIAQAIDGNQWKNFPESAQASYVMGVVDSWHGYAAMEEEKPSRDKSVARDFMVQGHLCIKEGMTYIQLNAVVAKWMAENPAKWHNPMFLNVWYAVAAMCMENK